MTIGVDIASTVAGGAKFLAWESIDFAKLVALSISKTDRVIISTKDPGAFMPLIEKLSEAPEPVSILLLVEGKSMLSKKTPSNVSILDLSESATRLVEKEWRRLDTRRKALELIKILSPAPKIGIMTQNDPDPDAIACGLAIQALLGRNRATAPIVTLGEVTRSENRSMISLLKSQVLTITPDDLNQFDKIAMVDVSPPYFAGQMEFDVVDAVLDHHPYPKNYKSYFSDIDLTLGATSTMIYEYLDAVGVKVGARLATALLYGITTDTMHLSRDTSQRDFLAFSALWPLANHQTLSAMSRPRLKRDELDFFVRAIKKHTQIHEMNFVWLGKTRQPDIVPRIADFALQFGESTWSAVAAIYEKDLVISLRYTGQDADAGALSAFLFSNEGSAGGHKSMAKAVVPLSEFKATHGVETSAQIRARLVEMFDAYFSG